MLARQVSALLALAGCDSVWGIAHVDPSPALCGPYGAPTRVAFDPLLQSPSDFSVAADGMHGLVTANVGGVTGPTPIIYDAATETWSIDQARNAGAMLQAQLTGAHMGEGGDVYGWVAYSSVTQSSLQHYIYSTLWGARVENLPVSSTFQLTSGQEVEIAADNDPGVHSRFLPEITLPTSGAPPHSFDILTADFASNSFRSSGFVTDLNNDVTLDVNGAALTAKHQILVYSAILAPDTEAHLYETQFARNHFTVGTKMQSLYVPGHPDDQPWVSSDCSTIWFRRDDAVWMAHK